MEYKLKTAHEAQIKPNAVVLLKRIDEEHPTERNRTNDELSIHESTFYEYPYQLIQMIWKFTML